MKYIFQFLLLFSITFASAQADIQFVLVTEFGTSTVINDSMYQINCVHPISQLGQGYLPTQIAVDYLVFDAFGRRYRVKTNDASDFGTSTLTVVELQDQNIAPSGVGVIYQKPTNNDLILIDVEGNTGLSPATIARIQIHNALNTGVGSGGGSGTDDQTASEVSIIDAGNLITGDNVETALSEAFGNINAIDLILSSVNTLTGMPILSNDLGTFTGNIVSNNATIKAAIQELETYAESNTGTDDQTASEVSVIVQNGIEQNNVQSELEAIRADIASGGDGWGSDVVNTDETLTGGGTAGSVLKVDTTIIATKTDLTGLSGELTTVSDTEDIDLTLTGADITATTIIDAVVANNILSKSGDGIKAIEVDGSVTNEIQTLSIASDQLTLSDGGGTVTLPSGGKFIDGTDPLEAVYMEGNVGIGINNPAYSSHVIGDAFVSGNTYYGLPTNYLSTAGADLQFSSGRDVLLNPLREVVFKSDLALSANSINFRLGNRSLTFITSDTNTGSGQVKIDTNTDFLMQPTAGGDVGIGTTNALYKLDINTTSGIRIGRGTTAQRGIGVVGYFNHNTTTGATEGHNGTSFFRFMQQSDVTPANGQIGVWNSTTNLYEPTTLAAGGTMSSFTYEADNASTLIEDSETIKIQGGEGIEATLTDNVIDVHVKQSELLVKAATEADLYFQVYDASDAQSWNLPVSQVGGSDGNGVYDGSGTVANNTQAETAGGTGISWGAIDDFTINSQDDIFLNAGASSEVIITGDVVLLSEADPTGIRNMQVAPNGDVYTATEKIVIPVYCQDYDATPTADNEYRGWRVPAILNNWTITRIQYSFQAEGTGTTLIQMGNGTINVGGATIPIGGYVDITTSVTLATGDLWVADVVTLNGTGHEGLMLNLTIENKL